MFCHSNAKLQSYLPSSSVAATTLSPKAWANLSAVALPTCALALTYSQLCDRNGERDWFAVGRASDRGIPEQIGSLDEGKPRIICHRSPSGGSTGGFPISQPPLKISPPIVWMPGPQPMTYHKPPDSTPGESSPMLYPPGGHAEDGRRRAQKE